MVKYILVLFLFTGVAFAQQKPKPLLEREKTEVREQKKEAMKKLFEERRDIERRRKELTPEEYDRLVKENREKRKALR